MSEALSDQFVGGLGPLLDEEAVPKPPAEDGDVKDMVILGDQTGLPETPSVINLDYKEPLPSVDVTYNQKSPLEQLADLENDTSPAEVPVSGTEVAPPPETKDPVDPFMRKIMTEAVAKEVLDVKLAETEAGLGEVTKLKEEVAGLKEQIEQLRKLIENKNPEAEAVKTEVMPEEKVETTPESPKEKEPNIIDTTFEETNKPAEPEKFPLEIPRGDGGESWAEGVGHDTAMAATEAFAEETQRPDRKDWWGSFKEKGSRWGKWLLERAKGLGTFGYWEVHQAEKVRVAGRDIQKDIVAGGIKQESGRLTHEDAWSEAEQINNFKAEITANGEMTELASSRGFYEMMSEGISKEKKEANQKLEDELVAKALATIKEKTASYRTYSGEKLDLPEAKLKQIEDKLRSGIGALRTSQLKADEIKFNKIVRESLDTKWYKRYVAGGIEAAIGFTGLYWVTMPNGPLSSWFFGKGTVGATKEAARQVLHSTTSEGVSSVIPGPTDTALHNQWANLIPGESDPTRPLTSNLWNMAKQMFADKGIPNPTDSQIMEVTKQLATDNATAVEKWGLAGKVLDTKMPVGMVIRVAGAAARIAKIASGF